jgi:hypothetical protein
MPRDGGGAAPGGGSYQGDSAMTERDGLAGEAGPTTALVEMRQNLPELAVQLGS